MKQVQMDKTLAINPVSAPEAGATQKVYGLGPLTVAVQLSISAASTPNTASGQLQGSIDGSNFFNVGSPVTISTNGQLVLVDTAVAYAYYRVNYAIASGSFSVTERWFVYGETI